MTVELDLESLQGMTLKDLVQLRMPPVIAIDRPMVPIDPVRRKRVKEHYQPHEYPTEFADHWLAAVLTENGDYLMLPPEYGKCDLMYVPKSPPKIDLKTHQNSPVALKLLEE